MTNDARDRIANIGAGMVPTYHATESVEEARAVVESCCSATEDLRRMLDERGIEHDDACDITLWTGVDGCAYTAVEMVPLSMKPSKKLMVRQVLTPEQAIATTLGSSNCSNSERTGTCRMRLAYEEEDADGFIWPDHYECDSCGAKVNGIMLYCDTEIQPKFCPNCGRKVVA